MKYFMLITSMLMLFSTLAFSEVFKWTDRNGTENFTDDLSKIPSRYRKKAVPIGGTDDDSRYTQPQGGAPATRGSGTKPPADTRRAKKSADDGNDPADKPVPAVRNQTPVDALARELLQNAVSDRDKAYAAFSWIRANITYDNATKWQRRYGNTGNDQSPDGVLASRRAVCEGMANLFSALAARMGLQSEVVLGKASGARQENHAWNAVMVDGQWGLVDITRHSFLSPPGEFLARHFPFDPRWQLIDRPLTYEEWLKR
ncbi:MAG TPA: transglutaminase domain-containing protein [Geobacteraceae bacterium]